MKTITLCADDFAQSEAISVTILDLIEAGRITATSAMTQSPLWPSLAPALQPLAERADIGLHFNLTHPFDASAKPLSHWLMKSQLRQLSRRELLDAMLRQIDRFAEHFGRLPDYIDGHQHVHALPVVRAALFDAIEQRWDESAPRPYLRAPDRLGHPGDNKLKALVLRSLCTGFHADAREHGYAVTDWFGGAYSLTAQAPFPALMRQWLQHAPSGALLMCHPGPAAQDKDDPIAAARAQEARFIASNDFAALCRELQVKLGRFAAAELTVA